MEVIKMAKIDIENSLIVAVDLQNDFIFENGAISSKEAKI